MKFSLQNIFHALIILVWAAFSVALGMARGPASQACGLLGALAVLGISFDILYELRLKHMARPDVVKLLLFATKTLSSTPVSINVNKLIPLANLSS